jgi:protease-4
MENNAPSGYSTPPPLITRPPPPPPRQPNRAGRVWIIAGIIMVCLAGILVVSAASVFHWSAKRVPQTGHRLQEVVVEDNDAGDKIAIVDVKGLITSEPWGRDGDNLVDLIEDQLKLAGEDEHIRAVILKVDSPGGEVMASDDISRTVRDFQRAMKKPVIASMGGLAASGGYYVSVPCEWIVANEMTITGSIGVILSSFNYRGLLDKIGVRPEVFKSGKFKDMLRGSKAPDEILPEERQMLQGLIDETYEKFKTVVAEGRKQAYKKHQTQGARALNADWTDYADGRILTGKQAYDRGFVDELGNFDTAVERAKKLAGIRKANLVRYVQPFDLSNLLRLLGKSEKPGMKIDLGLDLPKVQAGRLYFLSPTVLH